MHPFTGASDCQQADRLVRPVNDYRNIISSFCAIGEKQVFSFGYETTNVPHRKLGSVKMKRRCLNMKELPGPFEAANDGNHPNDNS